MKKGYTHIGLIIDASTSMKNQRDNTIQGLNLFLDEQTQTGQAGDTVSVYQFSTGRVRKTVVAELLSGVAKFSRANYSCDGGTALFDAIEELITDTDALINNLADADKPERVVLCVLTDGEENSSVRVKRSVLAKLINEKQTADWQFVFLGANQDAILSAAEISVAQTSSMDFNIQDKNAYGSTMRSLSSAVSRYKMGNDAVVSFTAAERTASMGGDIGGGWANGSISGVVSTPAIVSVANTIVVSNIVAPLDVTGT